MPLRRVARNRSLRGLEVPRLRATRPSMRRFSPAAGGHVPGMTVSYWTQTSEIPAPPARPRSPHSSGRVHRRRRHRRSHRGRRARRAGPSGAGHRRRPGRDAGSPVSRRPRSRWEPACASTRSPSDTVRMWRTDVRSPQVCVPPAAMALNGPALSAASPSRFGPQQTARPDRRSPQLWRVPAATCVKGPSLSLRKLPTMSPQHTALPDRRSPHTCVFPAETCVKTRAGTACLRAKGSSGRE